MEGYRTTTGGSSTTSRLILAAASVLGSWVSASACAGGSGSGAADGVSAAARSKSQTLCSSPTAPKASSSISRTANGGRGTGVRHTTSLISHAVEWWSVPELVRRGLYLLDEGCRVDRADELLSQACRLDPEHVQAHFSRARLKQMRTNDADAACRLYERVLQLDSSHVGAMNNYALQLHTPPLEEWGDAEELYERILEMRPGMPTALANYAVLQQSRRDGRGGGHSAEFLYEEAMLHASGGGEKDRYNETFSAIVKE